MPHVVTGVFFLLLGLGCLWLVLYLPVASRASTSSAGEPDPVRHVSSAEMALFCSSFGAVGLGIICMGISVLRYAQGPYVIVPDTAPLIDRIIWVLAFVGMGGGFAAVFVWAMVCSIRKRERERRHAHREEDGK